MDEFGSEPELLFSSLGQEASSSESNYSFQHETLQLSQQDTCQDSHQSAAAFVQEFCENELADLSAQQGTSNARPEEDINDPNQGLQEIISHRFNSEGKGLEQIFGKIATSKPYHYHFTCLFCCALLKTTEVARLKQHARTCSKVPESLKDLAEFEDNNSSARNAQCKRLNSMLAKAVIGANAPLTLVEYKPFKELMRMLNPRWTICSRREMSCTYVPALSRKVERQFSERIQDARTWILSVEFDHWQDLIGRSLLGILSTEASGYRFLIALEDVSLQGHSTAAILDPLERALGQVQAEKINSFISDSAKSCELARITLSKYDRYGHVIQHRCVTHFLNLIGKHFCKSEQVEDIIVCANKLVAFISKSQQISAKLQAAGHRRVTPQSFTRWFYISDTLRLLLDVKEDVTQLVTNRKKSKEREYVLLLKDKNFWSDLKKVFEVIEPLASCIALSESATMSLGESIRSLFEWVKILHKSDWNSRYITDAYSSFLEYFNQDKLGSAEYGLMITAYCLDRRNASSYLTNEALEEIVLPALVDIACKSGFSPAACESILVDEFADFCKQRGRFGKIQCADETPLDWWAKQSDSGVLKTVAVRICSLRATSTNLERLFSVLKYIQGHNRTRFNVDKLLCMARVKLSLSQNMDWLPFDPVPCGSLEDHDDGNIDRHGSQTNSSFSRMASSFKRVSVRILERLRRLGSQQDQIGIFPRPELLRDAGIRECYNNFVKHVDFYLVRTMRQEETNMMPESALEETVLDQIKKRFKNARVAR